MANIYDGAFRTILNDCRKLIIPVINEIFGELYTGEEEIEFSPNEHFLDQQDAADKERITDTNFRIPHTAVIYLRAYKKTPDKMKYVIITPGGTDAYNVPIMKVQTYSLDDIFDKRLLFLIPFYIFSHEKGFPEYNRNEQKLEKLKQEYMDILARLDDLERQEIIGAFDKRTIIEISGDVLKEITKKYENLQKGVGGIMSGALLETSARKLRNEANKETALRMLKRGKLTLEEIAEDTGLSIAEVKQLAELQTV